MLDFYADKIDSGALIDWDAAQVHEPTTEDA
jgi:hypothetical protein